MVRKEVGPKVSEKIWIEIVTKGGSMYPVTEDYVKQLKETYPKADVEQELRSMASWCDANATRRKTQKGMKRFINSWLNRARPRYERQPKKIARRDYDNERSFLD